MSMSKTSFNELAFYYYLSKVFDCKLHSCFSTSYGNLEYDLFLPDYNILIEYDSYYYHLERYDFDKVKDEVAVNQLGYTLIRVRERPLNRVSDLSKVIYREDASFRELNVVIAKLIIYVKREFDLIFDMNIDSYRDKRDIALLKAAYA